MSKNILITGGAGFIGSNLVEYLVKKGYSVTVIDNLSTGSKINLSGSLGHINFQKLDIENIDAIKKHCTNVDAIIHLAAIGSVLYSIQNPLKCHDVNINSTLKLLDFAAKNNVQKFVFASSCAIYGNPNNCKKVNECFTPQPLTPYALTKLTIEYYCKLYTEFYNLNTVSLRFFNVFGPRQSADSDYSAVIPKFISKLSNNEPPFIYGDGTQTRDFVFVKDVISATELAMNSTQTGIYNIGTGNSYSVNELYNLICKILNKQIQPVYKNARDGEVRFSNSDISLAQKQLGYYPQYDLENGLITLINETNLTPSTKL